MDGIKNMADQMACEGCTECSMNEECRTLGHIIREVRKEQIGSTCCLSLCECAGSGQRGYTAVLYNRDYASDPFCISFCFEEEDSGRYDRAFAEALSELEDQMQMRLEGMNVSYNEVLDAMKHFCKD